MNTIKLNCNCETEKQLWYKPLWSDCLHCRNCDTKVSSASDHESPNALFNKAEAIRLLKDALEQMKALEWEVSIGTIAEIENFLKENGESKDETEKV